MSETVIEVDNLWKRYQVGVIGTGSLRHDLNRWWHRVRGKDDPYTVVNETMVRKAKTGASKTRERFSSLPPSSGSPEPSDSGLATDEMWALHGISFEVKQGEILGIVGSNGAGKSTLLKILSRVTAPTHGTIRAKGRLASLLEVGSGFHPDLTGRENIFLNGGILGMTKAEVRSKLDEIVDFAEIERYLDTPVKRYSSGMYMRLAFAVAAHLDPEILILDEVLAVGDASFQKKCLAKMKAVASKGRTILFVSHNMEAVRNLCHRGIWLKQGQIHKTGSPDEIVEAYFSNTSEEEKSLIGSDDAYRLTIHKVRLKNQRGEATNVFYPGDDLTVEIHYEAQNRLEKPYLTLGVIGGFGSCFVANMLLDGAQPEALEKTGVITCRFKSIPLLTQDYTVNLAVRAKNGVDMIIDYRAIASFRVTGDLANYGYKGSFLERAGRHSSVVIPYVWGLPDGTSVPISLTRPTE